MRYLPTFVGIVLTTALAMAGPEDIVRDRTRSMEERGEAVKTLVEKDPRGAAKVVQEAMNLEKAESGDRGSVAHSLVIAYFEAYTAHHSAELLSDTTIEALLTLLSTKPMGFIQASSFLDDDLFTYGGSLCEGVDHGSPTHEMTEEELSAFQVRLFLKAVKNLPLAHLGFLLDSTQAYGINWRYGSAPSFPYKTTDPEVLGQILEIYRTLLGERKFVDPPGEDDSYTFSKAQAGLDTGVSELMKEADLALARTLPPWADLVQSARQALDEELEEKKGRKRLQARLDAAAVILFSGLPEADAFSAWSRYSKVLSAEKSAWGRTLARISRGNPTRFASWLREVVAKDSALAHQAIETLFSKDGDSRSAGSRLVGGILESLARETKGQALQITTSDPGLPPHVAVSGENTESILRAAREGAIDILSLHLSERQENREKRAAFQDKPPRKGATYALYGDQYFAFALLLVADAKAALEMERHILSFYGLTSPGYEAWGHETNPQKLLGEAIRLEERRSQISSKARDSEQDELFQETAVGLTIRGKLLKIRQELLGNDSCAYGLLNQ